MLEHPGTELQVIIKEKGLTQKAFASILGKKVSEVNELLKGKRNITIQRDYLLHQTLGTPIKYWILKQVDYDYSLLDIEESNLTTHQSLRDTPPNREQKSDSDITPLGGGDDEARGSGLQHTDSSGAVSNDLKGKTNEPDTQDFSLQAPQNDNDSISSGATAKNSNNSFLLIGEGQGEVNSQETPIQESKREINEDFKKRARIFKSF